MHQVSNTNPQYHRDQNIEGEPVTFLHKEVLRSPKIGKNTDSEALIPEISLPVKEIHVNLDLFFILRALN